MNYPLTVIKSAWRRIRRPSRWTVKELRERPPEETIKFYDHLLKDVYRQVGIPDAMLKELNELSDREICNRPR